MNIGKAFGSMALVTLLSRVSGFLRVAIFAAYYGSGPEADIFLSVMILPELMYRFIADGLISSASVPMFVRKREQGGESRKTFWTLFWGIAGVTLPVMAVLVFFAEPICGAMMPAKGPGMPQPTLPVWGNQ